MNLKNEVEKRYEEDARLLIKKLLENKIKFKNGELNSIGVFIIIDTARNILETETPLEAIKKL